MLLERRVGLFGSTLNLLSQAYFDIQPPADLSLVFSHKQLQMCVNMMMGKIMLKTDAALFTLKIVRSFS